MYETSHGPPVQAAPRRPKHAVLAVMVAAVVLLGMGLAVLWVNRPRSVTLSGTMTITVNIGGDRACFGMNSFEDIRGGASVIVRAPSGEIIGSGALDDGVGDQMIYQSPQRCRFAFRIPVPRERSYGVEVSHRGLVRFTAAQVDGGHVELSA